MCVLEFWIHSSLEFCKLYPQGCWSLVLKVKIRLISPISVVNSTWFCQRVWIEINSFLNLVFVPKSYYRLYVFLYLYLFSQQRKLLEKRAEVRTSVLTWVGLGLMSVQFGILARLTWWEYSWDIMEPVTYFVTYGTAMATYAYFALTKQVEHRFRYFSVISSKFDAFYMDQNLSVFLFSRENTKIRELFVGWFSFKTYFLGWKCCKIGWLNVFAKSSLIFGCTTYPSLEAFGNFHCIDEKPTRIFRHLDSRMNPFLYCSKLVQMMKMYFR